MHNRDGRRNDRRPRNNRFRKKDETKKRKKKEGYMSKKCPHCDTEMKARGASDCNGSLSWKCRNPKCGKTVWTNNVPTTPPVPLAPTCLNVGG